MRASSFFLATALATAIASPAPSTPEEARAVLEGGLEQRETCWNRSSCGRFWSGKCEDYCKPYKFSHMAKTDCGWLAKRCCCKT